MTAIAGQLDLLDLLESADDWEDDYIPPVIERRDGKCKHCDAKIPDMDGHWASINHGIMPQEPDLCVTLWGTRNHAYSAVYRLSRGQPLDQFNLDLTARARKVWSVRPGALDKYIATLCAEVGVDPAEVP